MASSSEIHQNQNASVDSTYNREEEYRLAKRAGAEAVAVGRETLETLVHQGEQLRNAENIADDTVYTVGHANRVLRGMTWSGWLSNKFSKPVNSPEYRNQNIEIKKESIIKPLKTYETVPESCRAAWQSIQNYHLNLQVLEACETSEQKGTCKLICESMYKQANIKITEVLKRSETNGKDSSHTKEDFENYAMKLKELLSHLRHKQLVLQQISGGSATTTIAVDKKTLFDIKSTNCSTEGEQFSTNETIAQQEDHLNALSDQFRELGLLAGNISISAEQQAETVISLDSKNETLHFKMNLMNRRTDQLIKDKSWSQQKAEFCFYARIQHDMSGCYLSTSPNNDSTLILSNVLNEKCIFGIFKRGRVIGLQNKYNRRWVGRNMVGKLSCSASSFNRKQEWETDGDNWNNTTLLIVSGGWGTGGYLLLDNGGKGTEPIIGGSDFVTKKQAPKWRISEFSEH